MFTTIPGLSLNGVCTYLQFTENIDLTYDLAKAR